MIFSLQPKVDQDLALVAWDSIVTLHSVGRVLNLLAITRYMILFDNQVYRGRRQNFGHDLIFGFRSLEQHHGAQIRAARRGNGKA